MNGLAVWRGWLRPVARRRWRGLLFVSIVTGLVGGFTTLAVVATQRANSSWDRLTDVTRSQDLLVTFGSSDEVDRAEEVLLAAPGVAETARLAVLGSFSESEDGDRAFRTRRGPAVA